MAIFLLILKIIGIILLSVLGLAVLLILMVLFVPIRLRLNGDFAEDKSKTCAVASVTYLLHIISARVSYIDGSPDFVLRVFGIPIKRKPDKDSKAKKNKVKNKKVKNNKEKKDKPRENEIIEDNHPVESDGKAEIESDIKEEKIEYTIETWEDVQECSEQLMEPEEPESPSEDSKKGIIGTIAEKIIGFINFIGEVIVKIYETMLGLINNTQKTVEKIHREADFYSRYIQDERNKKAVSKCIKYLKKILLSVKPRKIKGNLRIGMDDPAATGKILMYLSIIYPVMPKKFKITPDFDNKVIEGNVLIKGRIIVFVIVWAAAVIYFDRDVKRMIRIIKKHREK